MSDSDVNYFSSCSSAKRTVVHPLYNACKKCKPMRNQTLCISSLFGWLKNLIRELIQKFIYFFLRMYRNKGFFPLLVKYRFRQKGWNNLRTVKCGLSCSIVLYFLWLFLWDLLTSWYFFFFHMERVSLIWSYVLFKQRERMGKSFIVDTAAGSGIPEEFQ